MNKDHVFTKTIERDSTLIMQCGFAYAMTKDLQDQYGSIIPYSPMFIHYANRENVQIYENTQGMESLLRFLDKEHCKSNALVKRIEKDFFSSIAQVQEFWKKGSLIDIDDLISYRDIVRITTLPLSLAYYSGVSENEIPHDRMQIILKIREYVDLFSLSDEFIRKSLVVQGIPEDLTNLVLYDEVGSLPQIETLEKRKEGVIVIDGEKSIVLTIEGFMNTYPEYVLQDVECKDVDMKSISGQVAFRGKVSGIVRIVKNRKQSDAIVPGEILVSPMTTPDILSAMKTADAFVTDEGGITCHAAIVARELKKPCIIGTKIATKVLKDGDRVEVDANEGVVRKL